MRVCVLTFLALSDSYWNQGRSIGHKIVPSHISEAVDGLDGAAQILPFGPLQLESQQQTLRNGGALPHALVPSRGSS